MERNFEEKYSNEKIILNDNYSIILSDTKKFQSGDSFFFKLFVASRRKFIKN